MFFRDYADYTFNIFDLTEPLYSGDNSAFYQDKVSIIATKNNGVIIGALNIPQNDYDAHTLGPAINQHQRITGHVLNNNYVGRVYRGVKNVLGTNIITADKKNKTAYQKQKLRHGFRRRAGIEP